MQKILEQIAVTAELMGQTISPAAAAAMAMDLSQYPQQQVAQALACLRREGKGRFSLVAVIEQIERLSPDGRPGPDEAWAMIPRDEAASVVMSSEMAEAMRVAQPLLNEGDKIAARMAFKEAYTRIVEENKRAGVKPAWFPSLGSDQAGREAALADAVRHGRIGAAHAVNLIAPSRAATMLEMAGNKTLALEYKAPSSEEVARHVQELRDVLSRKAKV